MNDEDHDIMLANVLNKFISKGLTRQVMPIQQIVLPLTLGCVDVNQAALLFVCCVV